MKRLKYTRRFVNVTMTGGKRKVRLYRYSREYGESWKIGNTASFLETIPHMDVKFWNKVANLQPCDR